MLKRLIQIITAAIVVAIAAGYFYKTRVDSLTGERIIGIAVLTLTFILMPLFIAYRYKKTRLRQYLFPETEKDEDDEGSDTKLVSQTNPNESQRASKARE